MAWHSSGTTNDELVNNLIENGLISDEFIATAFRNVDRVHFVPKDCEDDAYDDRPLKGDNRVHISAPHIYCTVLDNLELEPNSSLSFLNIGVGTGYLSCIVANILGKKSQCFGVEIHADVLQHCNAAINSWKLSQDNETAHLSNFHGNGLNILDQGESLLKYDRIYVGAAIEAQDLEELGKLLAEGGVLVAPVYDRLTKVVRINNETTSQTITGVHFASLLKNPTKHVIIPAAKWKPSNHLFYPKSFQCSVKALLLCSNSSYTQPRRQLAAPTFRVNIASILPNHVWLHIISFTNRKWFDPKFCETESLKRRLRKQEARVTELQRENEALREANALVEHQRDLYVNLIRRITAEVCTALDQRNDKNHSDATRALLGEANMILDNYHSTQQYLSLDIDHAGSNMEVDDEDFVLREDEDEDDIDLSMVLSESHSADATHPTRSHRIVSITADDI